ncbi:MAG: spore coat U domain-containing protein [Sphingomonadales bacterium]|nr:spore coat U domain-containing protein [Sphingomonadales bacterium]MDE2168129.1 spore coat U domain-containing protein [Sphingomonadales bacterium]
MKKSLVTFSVFYACFAQGGAASAATATSTMNVSTTVQSVCVTSANDLSFGAYDPTASSPTDATTTISITCTSGTNFSVGLNQGTASGATVTARKMTNGSNLLGYTLYSDSSRSTNWGNTVGTDTPAQITAGSSPSLLTVYGRIAPQQNVPSGTYSDVVTVTVTY